jgi:hypothetical protein
MSGDAEQLASILREADRMELTAGGSTCHATTIQDGIERSVEAWVVVEDGAPALILGLAVDERLPGVGIPWLLSGDFILRERRWFVASSRQWLRHLHSVSPTLMNACDCRNEVHIRWLKWLGFEFGHTFTPIDHPFITFTRTEHV